MPLIETPRHSRVDIEAWQRLNRYDKALASSEQFLELEERAIETIRDFAGLGRCTIGTSWGKDSVVLAHLAVRAGIVDVQHPLVHVKSTRVDRRENPDVPLVRDEFLRQHDCEYFEYETDAEDALREMNDSYGPRYISGVRASESSQRVMAMKRHGISSKQSCRPIGYWKPLHIWTYLERYGLPIHPAYGMTFGGQINRDNIRVHNIGNTEMGAGVGRLTWERHYYKEVWNELDQIAI